MFKLREISRYRAASLPLIISAIIAFDVFGAMLALWYPPPYFRAMGGTELIALIVGVDIALGPLITLVVFDTRKKSLPFDLAFVALLQLAALSYGIYAMQSGRPVFTVFTGSRLAVVSAAEIEPEELAKGGREEFRRLSFTGPRVVAAEQPSDAEQRKAIAFAGLLGYGIQHLPSSYVPYAEQRATVLTTARTLDEIQRAAGADDNNAAKARSYVQHSGRSADSIRFLPVQTRQGVLLGVIDATTAELLDIL